MYKNKLWRGDIQLSFEGKGKNFPTAQNRTQRQEIAHNSKPESRCHQRTGTVVDFHGVLISCLATDLGSSPETHCAVTGSVSTWSTWIGIARFVSFEALRQGKLAADNGRLCDRLY